MPFLAHISAWWRGKDPEPELDTEPEQEEPGEGNCPRGGHHEWKDVNAATSRKPLYTYCTRCGETLDTADRQQ